MERLLDSITRIYQSSKRYRAEKAELPLLPYHQLYVRQLCLTPGCSQDALARSIGVSKSNAARQLAVLERDGFVTRTPDPEDRRALRLFPTEKALALFPAIEGLMAEWEGRLLREFSREERAQLAALLKKAAWCADLLFDEGGEE